MDYTTIQRICKNVINYSAACDGQLFTGTVTSAKPLKIKMSDEAGSIELDGDDLILTESVVSKKLYIKKHTHEIGSTIANHTHVVGADNPFQVIGTAEVGPMAAPVTGTAGGVAPATKSFNSKTEIVTSTLDAWVTEYGNKLPVDPESYNRDGDQTVITINRSLEEGDKVIMTRVSNGQQFIVLSRYFEVDGQGEDDT